MGSGRFRVGRWVSAGALALSILSSTVSSSVRAGFSPSRSHALDLHPTDGALGVLPRQPKTLWKTQLSGPLLPGAALTTDGHLLVATGDARLLELDSRGRTLWERTGV